jgi:hypothetical protein
LDKRLGGPQYRFERYGKEKNLAPTETRTPDPRQSIAYRVAMSAALSYIFNFFLLAECPVRLYLAELLTLIIFGEEYMLSLSFNRLN